MFKLRKLAQSIPNPLWVLGGIGLVAAVISLLSKLPFLLIFMLGAVAVFANRLLATVEDDLPGGLNNPDGSETPGYIRYVRIVGWGIVGLLAAFVALGLLARFL